MVLDTTYFAKKRQENGVTKKTLISSKLVRSVADYFCICRICGRL